jgi:hypothetical protein
MTLDEMVLQKLADWQAAGTGRQALAVTDQDSGWSVQFSCDQHDDLAIALWEVVVCRPGVAAADVRQFLSQWAQRVSGLTGLLEPLKLLEIDHQRVEALLRSDEPARREGALFYYEIILQGDRQALVRRYRGATPGTPREQISFTLTHEALAKLVRDLAEGAPPPVRPN